MREIQEFGAFRLDPGSRRLERTGGETIALGTKPFDALVFLVEHAGEPVSRKALIDALWPDTVVEDHNLTQAVSALRRVLGEGYIATLSGRGYQFVAEVRSAARDSVGADAPGKSAASPSIDCRTADGDPLGHSPGEQMVSAVEAPSPPRAGTLARPRVPVAARHSVGHQRELTDAGDEMVSRPLWRRALPVVTALILGGVATGLAMWFVTRPSTPALERFDVTPDGGLTVFAAVPSAAVSPNGQSIAYLVGNELRLRRLDQLDSATLADEGGSAGPFFSPDGTQIGFAAGAVDDQVLKRVSIQGGAAVMITKLPAGLRGASWGSDGTIVYGTRDTASGLWRVRATGGEPEMLTKPDPESGVVDHWWPEILPGGKAVLFTMVGASEQDSKIAVLSLATGEQRALLRGVISPHYSPTGHLLFGRAGTLFAVRFDAARLQIEGEPVPVQRGVMTRGNVGATEASLASNGTLLYLSGSQPATPDRHLYRVDAETGHETPVPLPPRAYDQVVLSPDGTHAALGIQGDKAVWFADLERGTLDRLPADLGDKESSILFFSADGRRVASSATRDGRQAVVWQAIDGTGATEPLATFDASVRKVRDGALSPDGTRFAPTIMRGHTDLGVVTVGDPKSYQDLVATPAQEYGAAISPDGHWIAYCSSDAGTFRIYLQRFPEGGGRRLVSTYGGVEPHWSADGNALTYLRLNFLTPVAMVRVSVTGLGESDRSPMFGTPKELFSWKYLFGVGGNHFDMTADGKHLFVIETGSQGDRTNRLVLVQNWSQQLNRLVPTK